VYAAWSRYLEVFDEVVVLARVALGNREKIAGQRADGPRVSFRALPDYTGPWQYFNVREQVRKIALEAIAECDAYVLRVPGIVSHMVWREVARLRRPYAVEALGDPWDALGPGSWAHLSRPIFRRVATRQMKRVCSEATALNYVTSEALQRRYPAPNSAYVSGFSDVALEGAQAPSEMLQQRHRRLRASPWQDSKSTDSFRIGFIGSFSRLYKAPDVLLRAAALTQSRGLNFVLSLVGAGRHLEQMKSLAITLGIADRTKFLGHLSPGNKIFDFLDSTDLFVIPSRAEGTPRALLEAMARGCPCIGSAVGGIPELLEPANLAMAGDPECLAKSILHAACDAEKLVSMSSRNWAKAREFNPETLQQKRKAFLEVVRERSGL
jgi:glycosyltransferase involved in cell wall biosynthesis